MSGGLMPNRLERLLEKNGGLVEIILSLTFFLTGIIGIAIYTSNYVDSIFGLPSLNISVLHSLAFLAIMVVFMFVGFELIIDFLLKTF
jgi:uncharacterized membrane protein YdbT with pleckstrin-like domain